MMLSLASNIRMKSKVQLKLILTSAPNKSEETYIVSPMKIRWVGGQNFKSAAKITRHVAYVRMT